MGVKSYVLTNVSMGEVSNTLEELKAFPEVKSAVAITGPYDIVAVVEAEDVSSLGQLVTRNIQGIKGVRRTITCIVIE